MIASAALSTVQSYIDDVLSGDIVTGELVRLAVQRHVDDLKRERTDEFPYYFDSHHAEMAIEFFGTTLKHSIGDFVNEPFILAPWQAFGVANIFGWKRISDGTRKYRRVYWSTGRKNGKSTFAAGVALFLASFDTNPKTGKPESVANIIICATKREQAKEVIYKEILRMRRQSPIMSRISNTLNQQVMFPANEGSIRCIGSDKQYDGLNPHGMFKDEVHAFSEYQRDFYDTLTTAGGTRSQQIDVTTTTAGDTMSRIWLEEYNHLKNVLRKVYRDEALFGLAYEIDEEDDPLEEANWIKANPNLGVAVKLDYLREQAALGQSSPAALNRFTRYHGNRIVSSRTKAFELTKWRACQGQLSPWKSADAIGGGVDLGGRDDLAAWALVARFPLDHEPLPEDATTEQIKEHEKKIWRYEIKIGTYIADDSDRDLTKEPFAQWVHEGYLTQCSYPISELERDFIDACNENGVADVAFDPHNGQQLSEDLDREGILAARMQQTHTMFNEPIHDFIQAMRNGRITHNGNPLLEWCFGNAMIVQNSNGLWMFDKQNSSEKIDPAVAVIMAYRRAMVAPRRPSGSMFIAG